MKLKTRKSYKSHRNLGKHLKYKIQNVDFILQIGIACKICIMPDYFMSDIKVTLKYRA